MARMNAEEATRIVASLTPEQLKAIDWFYTAATRRARKSASFLVAPGIVEALKGDFAEWAVEAKKVFG